MRRRGAIHRPLRQRGGYDDSFATANGSNISPWSGTVSVSWNDKRLVQRIAAENWKVVRTSSLAPDGKTITADWVLTQDGNTLNATEVWEKQ